MGQSLWGWPGLSDHLICTGVKKTAGVGPRPWQPRRFLLGTAEGVGALRSAELAVPSGLLSRMLRASRHSLLCISVQGRGDGGVLSPGVFLSPIPPPSPMQVLSH